MEHIIEIGILGGFLLTMLLIGGWYGRAKNLQEYAVANKSLNTGILSLTLLATYVGAGDLSSPHYIVKYGLMEMGEGLFGIINFLLIGFLLAPKILHFKKCMTMGDTMEQLYGKPARMMTNFIGVLFCLLVISAQIRVVGNIMEAFLPISTSKAKIILGTVIILYSMLGGMRAVAITDILQFFVLTISLLFLTNVIIFKVDGIENLLAKGAFLNFSATKLKSNFFWGLLPFLTLTLPTIQRMLMIKDRKQAQYMFVTGMSLYGVLRILLMLIGIGAIVYGKDNEVDVSSIDPLVYFTKLFFAPNTLLRAFLLIGFLCVLMSTIDSYLHSGGISLAQELFDLLKTKKKQVWMIRFCLGIIGVLAISLALLKDDIHGGYYSYYTAMHVNPIVVVPFILGVLGIKTDSHSFWVFVSSYILSVVSIFFFFSTDKYTPLLISLGVSLLAFFISHYHVHNGFVTINREENALSESTWRLTWDNFFESCKQLLDLPTIARQKVAAYTSEPLLFSIFIIITSIIPNITTQKGNIDTFVLSSSIYGIGIALCIGLMLRSLWPKYLQPYFDLYWFVTVLYCVPFTNVFLFLEEPNNSIGAIKLTVMLLLLVVLVDWKSFFVLLTLGSLLAFFLFQSLHGKWMPAMTFHTKWTLCWGTIPALLVGLLFARRKQVSTIQQKHNQ